MMDHKRDSDHPSKRKCNQFPDCERNDRCWFVHRRQTSSQINPNEIQPDTRLTCNTCEQVFSDRNELMFHKKRVHPSNITCSNFLAGYCRRGERCWYRHELLPTPVQNVERPPISLPPPGSPSWNQDFPVIPTMGQSPVVGLQQQLMIVLNQQRQQQQQQQQQHQQQLNIMMSQ